MVLVVLGVRQSYLARLVREGGQVEDGARTGETYWAQLRLLGWTVCALGDDAGASGRPSPSPA